MCRDIKLSLNSYGVKVGLKINSAFFYENSDKIIPPFVKIEEYKEETDCLTLSIVKHPQKSTLYFKDELILTIKEFNDETLDAIRDKIHFAIASVSAPHKYHFHAGAVSYKGVGIILPAGSFSGKTTLSKEFISRGATYYSDDFAIVDNKNYLYPSKNPLAIRLPDSSRVYKTADQLNSSNGIEKVEIKIILFTKYSNEGKWNPRKISQAQSIWELCQNFYIQSFLAINPAETLDFLRKFTNDLKMFQSERNEASEVVEWTFGYIDKKFNI